MHMIARNAVIAGLVMGLAMFSTSVWADPEPDDVAVLMDGSYRSAEAAIKAGDFKTALVDLTKTLESFPNAAGVFSYIGFVHRKMGDKTKSMESYAKALSIDPMHKGANEYVGELYLELDNLPKAEEHLTRLDKVCTFGCTELNDLKKAVADYKAKKKA